MMCYLFYHPLIFHGSSYSFSTRFFAEILWNHRTVMKDHRLLKRSRWGWCLPILWSAQSPIPALAGHPIRASPKEATGLCCHLGTWKLPRAWTRGRRNITAGLCLSGYLYLLEQAQKVEHLGSMMLFWAFFLAGLFPKKKANWQVWHTNRASQLICSALILKLPQRTSHKPQTWLRQALAPQLHF